mgnify:CR=1 FL=1
MAYLTALKPISIFPCSNFKSIFSKKSSKFSLIGSYAYSSAIFDVWVMLISGIIGYFALRNGFSPAPFVMGLILGKMVEETFTQSMVIYESNFINFFDSGVFILFMVLTVISLSTPFWGQIRSKLKPKPVE